MGSNYKPPKPAPGPPFLPETFASSVTQSETAGYLLTHTALQIRSAEVSLPFYLGMLGMTLIFALNAGPFTAYYLGYPQEGDKATGEIAATTGFRRGLLELIEVHDADGKEGTDAEGKTTTNGNKFGFAHLGITVPDVADTLRRAQKMGYQVMKRLEDHDERHMGFPSWKMDRNGQSEAMEESRWEGGFEMVLAQIAFIADPDGNWIEILPKELKL